MSKHIWGNLDRKKETFTPEGLEAIEDTSNLRDILLRNSNDLEGRFVGMTRGSWRRRTE